MSFHYIGNGSYCYANSTAMALSAIGKEYDPGYIECLTTVSISAAAYDTPQGPLTFFSAVPPNEGIGIALRNLGYESDHACWPKHNPDAEAAIARLRDMLQHGPVIAGPVDMGELVYNPHHRDLRGADHYVCVYTLNGDELRLHDPEGYPYISIALNDFLKAWQAEWVDYTADAYQMWGRLRQVRQPSADEVYEATEEQVRSIIARQRAGKAPYEVEVGAAAMHALAEQVKDGIPEYLRGHLVYFLLPLAAKRCADYARFYAPYDVMRAGLKGQQGQACGDAFVAMGRQNWSAMAEALHRVADLEQQFQQATVGSRELVTV